ncbi:MAG: cardiolipin synthase [Pseudomonadota bacterium]
MTFVLGLSFWTAYLVLSMAAVALALWRRRGFAGTLAWVLAIAALPVVGALGYLMLGNPHVRRTKRRRLAALERVRRAIQPCNDPLVRDLAALQPHARSLVKLASRLTGLEPTCGNHLELLLENARAFSRKEEAILGAKQSIWAEYYIIKNDDTGRRFLDLLIARAREGLDVRLLYDAVGAFGIDASRVAALQAAGGEVAEFLPVNPCRRRWATHLRNHRKILVVDGEIAFLGGMNVGDEYSGKGLWRARLPWRDTHLRLRGPAAHELAAIFDEDWCFTTDESLPLPARPEASAFSFGDSTVALLPSGPDQEVNATSAVYFSAIATAASRCYVESPYFIPDEPTLRALTNAALRDVDVRIIVPSRSDIPLMIPAIRSYYPALLKAGVRLFEYQPTMLHAKTMVVDGLVALVGSANLDVRSFGLNFEASALMVDPGFASALETQFFADAASSREITTEWLESRGFLTALGEGAAQLLSPLL